MVGSTFIDLCSKPYCPSFPSTNRTHKNRVSHPLIGPCGCHGLARLLPRFSAAAISKADEVLAG